MTQVPARESRNLYDVAREELDKIARTNRAFVVVIVLVMLGTFFDAIEQYNAGYAASAASAFFGVSSLTLSTQVEFITFGFMAAGAILAGLMGDYIGRKTLYSFNLLIYALGALLGALALNYWMFVFGRAVVGIGLGGEIATGLTLISELVPVRIRGQFTGLVNVGPGFGIFAVAALALVFLGPWISVFGGTSLAWRWFLGILVVPALLVFVYRRYIPETARFLISKGKTDEAFSVINMLADGKLMTRKRMLENYPAEKMRDKYQYTGLQPIYERPHLSDLFGGIYLKRSVLLIILSWITFSISGSYVISFPYIFQSISTQLNLSSTFILTTLLNIAALVGTALGAFFGGYSRKIVLPLIGLLAGILAGSVALVLSNAYLTIIFLFSADACFFICNTTVWLYSPELYPTRARNLGTGLILVSSLASIALMISPFTTVFTDYGLGGLAAFTFVLFLIFAGAEFLLGAETVRRDLELVSP